MPKSEKVIDVGKEFSRYPAGRTARDGVYSGQNFVLKILRPAIEKHEFVKIYFDNALSYGSSFLEEAFGGLIRDRVLTAKELSRRIAFQSSDPFLLSEIQSYIEEAAARLDNGNR